MGRGTDYIPQKPLGRWPRSWQIAEVVWEGNSQWKEETRPRYGKWNRSVMNEGGVGVGGERGEGMVWQERRVRVCFRGGKGGRRDWLGPEGLRC